MQFYRKRAYHSGPVSLRCRYYMPNWAHWPDLVGLLQATSDILTEAGIIDDDMWVANYDGSEIVGIDKANSRVEIEFISVKEGTILYELRDRRNTKRAKR